MRPTPTLTVADQGHPAQVPAGMDRAGGRAAHRGDPTAPAAPAIPAHALPHRTPAELLALARRGLVEARELAPDGLRYATAHLAALRAAAAVLAARARPVPARRGRLTNVWVLLTMVAPELGEWAAYFAASAGKRAAAEAGIPRVVSAREADDLVRAAESFVSVVDLALGLTHPSLLDELVA
jgi:hypothetical protein